MTEAHRLSSRSRLCDQLQVMLQLQLALNVRVTPDWAERQFAWHRAIYVEAAEYLEHLGTYKWWKQAKPDLAQANLELVDIWHFGLSWELEHRHAVNVTDLAGQLAEEVLASRPLDWDIDHVTDEYRHREVDALVASAGDGCFNLRAFVRLLAFGGMSFDALYEHYVGKNVLNGFRQDHGYQDGSYRKVWAGLEDNEHLTAIMTALVPEDRVPATIRELLEHRYRQLVLDAA